MKRFIDSDIGKNFLQKSFKKLILFAGLILFLFLRLAFSQNSAQNIEVTAEVDSSSALLGEDITYTVSVKGANLPDNISPNVEGLDAPGLLLVSTAQQRSLLSGSSFTIIINGKTIKQDKNAEEIVQFAYVLRPQRPGGFKIGPATITIGGQTYKSNVVTFDVSTQPTAPTRVSERAPVFLHVEVNPTRVFIGESILVKFYLFAEPDHEIVDLGRFELPKLDGFMKTDLQTPNKYKVIQQLLGNKPYNAIYLGRMILFPLKAGSLTVGSMKMEYLERQMAGTHPFFGPQYRQYRGMLESAPVPIEVLPLPADGKPANFSGAVGKFTMKAKLDKTTITVGESVNLEITIEGTGNLESTNLPMLNLPAEFQSYPPEKQDQRTIIGEQVHSTRTIKYILISQKEGDYSLGTVQFSYFDSQDGVYKNLQTPLPTITVNHTATIPNAFSAQPYTEIQTLGKDIQYIKPDADFLENQATPFYRKKWYIAIHFIPWFLLGGAFLLNRRKTKLKTDEAFSRRIAALPSARKRLKRAEDFAKRGNHADLYQELSEAILSFIADMMNLRSAGLTTEDIKVKLTEVGANEEVIMNVMNLLNRCDEARYGFFSVSKEKLKKDLKEAQNLIKTLVNLFRGKMNK